MPIEDLIYGGRGFLFGICYKESNENSCHNYWVTALAYLSYKGLLNVKWVAMENVTRHTLTNAYEQTFHALNSTSAQFAAHPSVVAISGLPVAAGLGFVPGLMMGLKRG